MQQQLAASENKFRELTSMSSDWVWETDSDLRFSWLSATYEQVTGIAPARVIGRFRFGSKYPFANSFCLSC